MEYEVSQITTAIYERGVLYLQEPITLPEHAQVRVQILEQVGDQDEDTSSATSPGETEVRHKTLFVHRLGTRH